MKSYSQKEKDIISALKNADSDGSFTLKQLFEKIFFREREGRALIIQTVDNYSVLYLKKDLFENKKSLEIESFLDLIHFIEQLVDKGIISFFPTSHVKSETMFFIQDHFNRPQPNPGRIILNSKGDYTSKPEHILDKNDEIIYNGIFLNEKINDFLSTSIQSNLFISEKIHQIDSVEKQPSSTLTRWLPILINTAVLLMLIFTTYYFNSNIKNIRTSLESFENSHIELKNNIDTLKTALGKADNISKTAIPKENTLLTLERNIFYGIDISHYNGSLVERISLHDTLSFVVCKATEGLHYKDAYFDSNWRSLKEKGIIRGAYHFYHIGSSPKQQAKHYLSVVKKWESNDIIPIVDIEGQSFGLTEPRKVDKELLQNELLEFLNYIENVTNVIPMIYVDKNFANTYLTKQEFAKYHLWLAEYTNKQKPVLPKTWANTGLKIWQKSADYHFKSQVDDFDVFFGDFESITFRN